MRLDKDLRTRIRHRLYTLRNHGLPKELMVSHFLALSYIL